MIWRHNKTKNLYRIVGFGVREADLVPVVMYTSNTTGSCTWVRPCEEFFDGRFTQINGQYETYDTDGQEANILFKASYEEHGVVRVARWPEGIVLWVGGEIAWKQWKKRKHRAIPVDSDLGLVLWKDVVDDRLMQLSMTPDDKLYFTWGQYIMCVKHPASEEEGLDDDEV